MMLQTPTAPLPPLPPQPPADVLDPAILVGQVTEGVVMVLLVVAVCIGVVKVLGPMARAMARRLEGKVGDPELRAEVDQLRDQLGEVDGLRVRVQELEERVEFAERLLSQKRDQDLLPREGR
jgi:hypothetical protein